MVSLTDKYRGVYGVEPICTVLPIALSTFYREKCLQRNPRFHSARALRDKQLEVAIKRVWQESRCVYGACKVWKQLHCEAVLVARCTMGRLEIQGVRRGKRCKTAIPSDLA